MENTIEMGLNRTGIQISPFDAKAMLAAAEVNVTLIPDGDESTVAEERALYIIEADSIGSVPIPGTLKGMVTTGMKKLTGDKPAFERAGTRLYDALIAKCEATSLPNLSLDMLKKFRNEEAQHFKLVVNAIENLGGDPTAQTPCADISGVEGMGLMQVINDPRTSVTQCLHAILVAELVDDAGWRLLIQLAEDLGQKEMAADFKTALEEEEIHLVQIQDWHNQSIFQQTSS
jgi:ferritin-like metal-binding protein YciE